ncbi:MAG: hypothetical protein WAW90_00895 [Minisyncoccia bacterium]
MEVFSGKRKVVEPEAEVAVPIEVRYSIEDDASRIRKTIDRYAWFIENNYKPDLPQDIKDRLEKGEEIADEDIISVVEKEYQDDIYLTKANEIREVWTKESEAFLENLKRLGRPLAEKYVVALTRYGVGGSYGSPNFIRLNIQKQNDRPVLFVIFHEIVHLTIQDLIEKHMTPHWTKERLVDLTMNKLVPEMKRLQRDPEAAEKIDAIFEKEFPNIEKIIADIAQLPS